MPSAQKLDRKVADEIEVTLRTGIFANPNNEQSHRVARNATRQSTRARKARESDEFLPRRLLLRLGVTESPKLM
jgi:hypothetical protein